MNWTMMLYLYTGLLFGWFAGAGLATKGESRGMQVGAAIFCALTWPLLMPATMLAYTRKK